jgi:hypothetical protein
MSDAIQQAIRAMEWMLCDYEHLNILGEPLSANWPQRVQSVKDAVAALQALQSREPVTLWSLRQLAHEHDGKFHGPNVEHLSIPEHSLLGFASAIIAKHTTPQPVNKHCACEWSASGKLEQECIGHRNHRLSQTPQPVVDAKPIAAVIGWVNGECVIQALDPSLALPAGMALYAAPQTVSEDARDAQRFRQLEDIFAGLKVSRSINVLEALGFHEADPYGTLAQALLSAGKETV